MKRKRQQDGNIFKARGIWYVRYFDTRVINGEVKRVRIAKQIAKVQEKINGVLTTITKAKARELAKPILAKVNQADRTPETAVSLVDFVERIYLPRMEQQKRPSTVRGYRDIWANHLKGRSAGLWMREIRTCDIQRILDEIARPEVLSSNSLRHVKSQMSGIFSYAKQQGYFDGENPARNTAIPPARLSEETYAYSLEEIGQILSVLPEPSHQITNLSETGSFQSGTAGTLHVEDWGQTYTAWAYQKKRFRPSFAMQTCPRPTRTTSRVQRMTPEQRWRS